MLSERRNIKHNVVAILIYIFTGLNLIASVKLTMAGILANSISVVATSNGLDCKYIYSFSQGSFWCRVCCLEGNLAVKNKRRREGTCNLKGTAMPGKGNSWFECTGMNLQDLSTWMGSPTTASNTHYNNDSKLNCKTGGNNTLVERGEEELDSNYFEQNLHPQDDSMAQQGNSFDAGSDIEFSPDLKYRSMENKDRLHFLEERNEEMLSGRILTLSRSNKFRSALELFESMKFSGLQPNVHACNSLLSCLLRNGFINTALSVYEFMRTNDILTSHTYSLILKAVANSHGFGSALELFVELERDSKQDIDVIVYNTMISICGGVNNLAETERIWRSMKDNGHVGTEVTYSLLISIFTRCGQNELAIDAYNEMVLNGLKPRNDLMHATISACTKEGRWDLALEVFQKIMNDGFTPNLVACNSVINSLGKAGKAELAFKIYATMKLLGHAADEYTWNALLSALHRANRHADVLKLFYGIKAEHCSQLNVHLYNTALMSCQKLGSWEKALQLLWQMEASGLPISAASYNLVIGACETARKPKVSLQIYEHMVHQKCTPDTFTYLSLIRSCIWGSHWNEVEEILNRAPNVSLYNAAIHGMCLRGKFESAKKLYIRMRKIGLKPDGKTWALMLQYLKKHPK